MTPEERNLVGELFDRLATLEDAPRDRDAERLIQDGLRQAPNATYALVQTVLIQDEALKRADARIKELEAQDGNGAEPPRQGGFLDAMRDSFFGRRDTPRAGSVPTVRPGGTTSGGPMGAPTSPAWGNRGDAQSSMGAAPMGQPDMGQPQMGMGQPPYGGGSGGSFLGTAAATAVGVIGSSLLLDSIRSMMGHHGGAHGAINPAINPPSSGMSGSASPWGGSGEGGSGGGGDLARQAGIDDIGRSAGGRDDGRSYGFADSDAARAPDDQRYVDENDDRHHPGQDDRFVDDDNDDDDIDDGDPGDFDDGDDQ
jgi:hypothetical protein